MVVSDGGVVIFRGGLGQLHRFGKNIANACVAVADEARLSCSIFIVYRLLTSVTHALI